MQRITSRNSRKNDSNDLKKEKLWCVHKRESWIRFDLHSFLPYLFQSGFHFSKDKNVIKEFFNGILNRNNEKIENFKDLINAKFGSGIAKHFMLPYNFKVWGYPAEQMNATWNGQRVCMVGLGEVLEDFIDKKEKNDWGPNRIFKYPKYGGNGGI